MTHLVKRNLPIGLDRVATPAHSIWPTINHQIAKHLRVTCPQRHKISATFFVWTLCLCWLVLAGGAARAEQLPIKTYTTADGLAQDSVNRIVRDSRGFLWFCTREGLSRFDGYRFTSYTTEQGLPHRWVDDLLETRDGSYWVAAGHWVSRFNLTGAHLFIPYAVPASQGNPNARVMLEDPSGFIWCGTDRGVYRMDPSQNPPRFDFVDMGMPFEAEGAFIDALIVDHYGALWCGTRGSGLYRRRPDGRVEHYTGGLPDQGIKALLEDNSGRLWAGTPHGLCRLVVSPDPNTPVVDRIYTSKDGLAADWVDALFESSDGTLWIGAGGLSEFREFRESEELREYRRAREVEQSPGHHEPRKRPDARRESFRTYTTVNGLSSSYIDAIAEDRDGNIWLGTDSGGAMKLVRSGFTSYTPADGLAAQGVDAVFEDRPGELCVISSLGRHLVNRFDGRRFTFVSVDLPKQITKFGWGYNQITFQDRSGYWWVPTSQGLCRFPSVARVEQLATTPPRKLYTTRDGLPFDEVFRLYEDSRGDIWISTVSPGANGLSRWRPGTGTIETFSEGDGLASLKHHSADAFTEDEAGNLWIGLGGGGGGLLRYAGGRFSHFTSSDGLNEAAIRSLYVDHRDHLWIATVAGLIRVDDPGASRPGFAAYGTGQGLSSDDVYCVTEDKLGRIFIGTGRGLDRLDPESGYIKHYTADDGLMRGKVTSAFRDRHDALWFASNVHGLCRLVPRPDPPETPPPILISGLRIAGVAQPVSQLGETAIGRLNLAPGQNQLNIDFVGLGFGPGEVLRYQYKLEGADHDWSPPSDQRSVNYPNLAAGRYRFLVRAVNAEGLASEMPATIAFTIRPPVWRQWWFLTLAALLLGLGVYLVYSARVARLLELERVRTRIATDLHDDIGANLSLIAMVSEVARGHLQRDDQRLKDWFSTIASTSRDTVDAMSDIVWAVNPRRDQFSDLIMRMRRLAEDFFAARNIDLSFNAPEPARALKVGADVRREVFLIFKESISNLVRHSRSTVAEVDLATDRGWLVLKVKDNGCGFDPAATPEGNGLPSMRQRAGKLGGSLDASSNSQGTTVTLRVPLDHRGRFWRTGASF
jgi:ligand-binding sensor domain-containing protein/two-component sensor histidine kinase